MGAVPVLATENVAVWPTEIVLLAGSLVITGAVTVGVGGVGVVGVVGGGVGGGGVVGGGVLGVVGVVGVVGGVVGAVGVFGVLAPVPANATTSEASLASLSKVNWPAAFPAYPGANETVTEVFPPASSVMGKLVLLMEYPVPTTAICVMLSFFEPRLESVSVPLEVFPRFTGPKLSAAGATFS